VEGVARYDVVSVKEVSIFGGVTGFVNKQSESDYTEACGKGENSISCPFLIFRDLNN